MDIWLERLRAIAGPPPPAGRGRTLLFWRGAGVPSSLMLEILMALGLQARGHRTAFSVCEGSALGCNWRNLNDNDPVQQWPDRCPACHGTVRDMLAAAGLESFCIRDCIPASRLRDLESPVLMASPESDKDLIHTQACVGYHAQASLLRYLRGMPLQNCAHGTEAFRAFLHAALLAAELARHLLDTLRPDTVVMQHGIYADWGPALDVFLHAGTDVVLWRRGAVADHLMFRRLAGNDLLNVNHPEPDVWEKRRHAPMTPAMHEELDTYLRSQRERNVLFGERELPPEALFRRYGLDPARPVWALFPHLGWDGASFGPEQQLFADQDEWLAGSLPVMAARPDIQWLVKAHPGERVYGNTRSVLDGLQDHGPLPDNIRLIAAGDQVNTYGLYAILQGAVTFCGTAGLEMAMQGKPVILARNAHYSGKGFTTEPTDQASYLDLLAGPDRLQGPDMEASSRAIRYAHHYFCERQMALPLIREHGGGLLFDDFRALSAGACPELDAICQGLSEGRPFVRRGSLREEAP